MEQQVETCAICRVKITEANKAKWEDGTIMLDAMGRPWCVTCAEEHNNIDWDKWSESQRP